MKSAATVFFVVVAAAGFAGLFCLIFSLSADLLSSFSPSLVRFFYLRKASNEELISRVKGLRRYKKSLYDENIIDPHFEEQLSVELKRRIQRGTFDGNVK